MNRMRAINICWWEHAIVVWVTSYTSEEFRLNDAVQWDKGATWSFCWKINLDGSFLIISQLASKSYGLACWVLSKLLPRFPAKSVQTEKLPFAKERPSTSCHTCGNFAGFLKTSEINQLFYLSLFRLALFKSQLTSRSIDLTPHVPTLSDSWNKFVSKLCQTSINSSNHHYWGWLSTSWHACQLCMILENVWHQSTLPPVIIQIGSL